MKPTLNQRLDHVRANIARACATASRDPGDVHLLAISKLKPLADVCAAFAHEQRAFGENYVQEAVEKVTAWAPAGVEWHFVGRIQSNKVRALANRFAYIHSIERLAIAERLNQETRASQKIFIQVNVGGEDTKAGVDPNGCETLVAAVAERCPKLEMVGLMVMPPLDADPEAARPHFRSARELLAKLRRAHPAHPLDQLSMGTSADYHVAIAEGATWIRIGTEIFGPRTDGA